jgi:hypothetical protein
MGRLTTDEKKHVTDLTKRRVAPRHILLSLRKQNSYSLTHINQIYRNRSIQQKEKKGPRTKIDSKDICIFICNYDIGERDIEYFF